MSEQQVVQTVSAVEAQSVPGGSFRSNLCASLRQFGTAVLVLLILAGIWFGTTEILVFLLKDAWSFSPRFS